MFRAERAGWVSNMVWVNGPGNGPAGHGSRRSHGEDDQVGSSGAYDSHTSSPGSSSQSSSGVHRLGGKSAAGGGHASNRTSHDVLRDSGGEPSSGLMPGLKTDKLSTKHGHSGLPASGAKQASRIEYPASKKRDGNMEQNASAKLPSSSGRYTSASDGSQGTGAHYSSDYGGSTQGGDGSNYGDRGVQHTSATGRGQDDLGLSMMTLQARSPNRGPSSGQNLYELYLTVAGRGLDPNNRSHWAFMICRRGDNFGDRHNVIMIDHEALLFMYEAREGLLLESQECEGRSPLAVWNGEQRQQGIQAMQDEPPPRDGRRRCQDWTVEVLLSLETQELVPDGTFERWERLVGTPARELAESLGPAWQELGLADRSC